MAESNQTRTLCKNLRERRGVLSYPLIAGKWAPIGWPDRLFVSTYFPNVLVEFKLEGAAGRVSGKQRTVLGDLHSCGSGKVFICKFSLFEDEVNLIQICHPVTKEAYFIPYYMWQEPGASPSQLVSWFPWLKFPEVMQYLTRVIDT